MDKRLANIKQETMTDSEKYHHITLGAGLATIMLPITYTILQHKMITNIIVK